MRHRGVRVARIAAAAFVCACSQGTGPKLKIYSPMTVTFDRQHVSQGDTLTWMVTLPGPAAAVAGYQLVLTFSGAGAGTDSVTIDNNAYAYNFGLIVPPGVSDGTLVLTVTIPAVGQSAQASVKVKDTTPPMFDSAVVRSAAMPSYNGLAFTGQLLLGAGTPDTLRLWVSDNHALAWVGWALGAPVNLRDSAAVQGSATESDFPMALPLSARGSGATMTVFTRDQDGNAHADTIAPMDIVTFNQHPVHTAPVLDTITDLAIDTKRGVVYLAQPDSGRVAVLSTATMTYQAPIPFMGRPISLDLTPGGDSLLVALDGSSSLAVVQLTGNPQIVGAIPVPPYPYSPQATAVYRVRVASDGHALVTMRMPDPETDGNYYTPYPLAVSADTVILNPLSNLIPYASAPPPSARSGDGSVVVGGGILYNVTTKAYGSFGSGTAAIKPFSVSVANSSTNVMMAGHLAWLTGANAPLGTDTLYGATIASNGTDAYVAESSCATGDAGCPDSAAGSLVQYSLGLWYLYNNLMFPEAGHAVNLSSLPRVARSLVVSPDNKTVIAIGGGTIMAVDLTTSTGAGASSAGRLHRLVAVGPRSRRTPAAASSSTPVPAGSGPLWNLRSMLTVRVERR